jgi:hypothetical protein
MVMVAPVVLRDLVVRAVLAVTAMWVWLGRSRVRSVRMVVMPVMVPPVVPVVVVELVVRQAVSPVSRVRTLPAGPVARAEKVDSVVMAVRVRSVLRAAPAISPAVTAESAVRVRPGVVVVRAVRAVSR